MAYTLWERDDEDGRHWVRASGPQGNSVDVSIDEDAVRVRDSKDDGGPVLVFTHAEWARHVEAVKDGIHDLPVGMRATFPGASASGPGS